jgi:hypothetical protein
MDKGGAIFFKLHKVKPLDHESAKGMKKPCKGEASAGIKLCTSVTHVADASPLHLDGDPLQKGREAKDGRLIFTAGN